MNPEPESRGNCRAMETVENGHIEKPAHASVLPPFPQRLENGSRCSLVSHSYAPLLLLDIPTRKKIPDRPASRSKNRPNRSTNALLTGSQQTRPDQQGRTASSRRPSQGLKCVQGEDITTRSLAGFDPALSGRF